MDERGADLMARVRPAKSNRFADGHRTLRQVIAEMASHQAAHLGAAKRALT